MFIHNEIIKFVKDMTNTCLVPRMTWSRYDYDKGYHDKLMKFIQDVYKYMSSSSHDLEQVTNFI